MKRILAVSILSFTIFSAILARARYYEAETGRFLQEDTELHPGRNSYIYALDNPRMFVDPFGTDVILAQEGYLNYLHQIVYIGNPQTGYTTVEFGPANENSYLFLPYNWQGYAYASTAQKIEGDILKQFPQNPIQDQFSILWAKMLLNSPKWKMYNLYNNNCHDFAQSLYKNLTITIGPK